MSVFQDMRHFKFLHLYFSRHNCLLARYFIFRRFCLEMMQMLPSHLALKEPFNIIKSVPCELYQNLCHLSKQNLCRGFSMDNYVRVYFDG